VDARFVVSIGAVLNDLLFLNRLYVFDEGWGLMRREPTESENVYLIRMVVSSLFEFLRLLDKGSADPAVMALLNGLDEEGAEDLRQVRALSHLRSHYERIRNGTLHYPWPSDPGLASALRALSDEEEGVEAVEDSMASIRATFADAVLVQLLIADPEAESSEEERRTDLEDLIRGLVGHVTAAIRLCQHIVVRYLEGLPDGVVRHHSPSGSALGSPLP
jgi:hypothetical protein